MTTKDLLGRQTTFRKTLLYGYTGHLGLSVLRGEACTRTRRYLTGTRRRNRPKMADFCHFGRLPLTLRSSVSRVAFARLVRAKLFCLCVTCRDDMRQTTMVGQHVGQPSVTVSVTDLSSHSRFEVALQTEIGPISVCRVNSDGFVEYR